MNKQIKYRSSILLILTLFVIMQASVNAAGTTPKGGAETTFPPQQDHNQISCDNGLKDGNETGVDCGGSCVLTVGCFGNCTSAYVVDYCDGIDNDKDCLVDEDCNRSRSPVQGGPVSAPKTNGSIAPSLLISNEQKQQRIESTTVASSAEEGNNPPSQSAPIIGSTVAETSTPAEPASIVEGTAVTVDEGNPVEANVEPPVQETQPEVQEATVTSVDTLDVVPDSLMDKVLRFFRVKHADVAAQGNEAPVNSAPNPDKIRPAPETNLVSESAPAAPSVDAAKEPSQPAAPEKKSFFARLVSIFT